MTRIDKQKALSLRLQGKTYTDIQKALGDISKSTLSLWLKDVVLSEDAKRTLTERTREKSFAGILRHNKAQTTVARKNADTIKRAGIQNIKHLSDRELMILAAALYWAEGYKRPRKVHGRQITWHDVSLTNADPKLVKAFLKCMVRLCGVEITQIRVSLRIFKHINAREAVEYWSKQLEIPKNNFTKTYLGISKSSMGKRPYNRLPYGIVQIRINNGDLFYKIMGWIEGLKISI
ncbi:MAG TPA: hypothetical protein VMR99_03565 [Candidatus Paceibacterota bacterium]|nr:hypothetical protein [Candidatus Paceibacterota bacterium]